MADRMTDSPPGPAAEPPRRRAWRWVLGCLTALVFLCCGGPILLVGGGWWYSSRTLRQNFDRAHADGLHGGDATAVYDHADAAFRQRYSRETFLDFVRRHPGLLERDQTIARRSWSMTLRGNRYLSVRVTLTTDGVSIDVTFHFRVDGAGGLALLGIEPELKEAVPGEVVTGSSFGGGTKRRRSRLRRLFD